MPQHCCYIKIGSHVACAGLTTQCCQNKGSVTAATAQLSSKGAMLLSALTRAGI